MLTREQLHGIMPDLPEGRLLSFLPFLQAAIAEFAIDAPARSAAFLAQVAHESGQFRFMEEIWGPTAAQRRYEPPSTLATRLGNTGEGDGKRFKGRGPIQITGRANYGRFGDLLGIDLVSDPARAAMPEVAFRIAGLFWSKNGLNELADQATADAFQLITRRINGGLNGLADRERFYAAARNVLGVAPAAVERGRAAPVTPMAPPFERGDEAVRAITRGRPRTAASVGKKAKPKASSKTKSRSKRTSTRSKTTTKPKRRSGTTARRQSVRSQTARTRAKAPSRSRRRSRAKPKS
jgi:predicted chitinase